MIWVDPMNFRMSASVMLLLKYVNNRKMLERVSVKASLIQIVNMRHLLDSIGA